MEDIEELSIMDDPENIKTKICILHGQILSLLFLRMDLYKSHIMHLENKLEKYSIKKK